MSETQVNPDELTAEQYANLIETVATGRSSQSLLSWLVSPEPSVRSFMGYWPYDADDLGRCERTVEALPAYHQTVAAPLLAAFRARVADNEATRIVEKTQIRSADPEVLRSELKTILEEKISVLRDMVNALPTADLDELEELYDYVDWP